MPTSVESTTNPATTASQPMNRGHHEFYLAGNILDAGFHSARLVLEELASTQTRFITAHILTLPPMEWNAFRYRLQHVCFNTINWPDL
jgi:hypothetical protein